MIKRHRGPYKAIREGVGPIRALKTSTDILRILNGSLQALKGKDNTNEDIQRHRAIIYGCSVAGNVIKTLEVEKRIEKLEEMAEKQ